MVAHTVLPSYYAQCGSSYHVRLMQKLLQLFNILCSFASYDWTADLAGIGDRSALCIVYVTKKLYWRCGHRDTLCLRPFHH